MTGISDARAAPEAILGLISKIYDAALEPERWQIALTAIAEHFSAVHSAIVDENYAVMTAQQYLGSMNLDETQLAKYNNRHIFTNPLRVPTLLTKKVGDTFTAADVLGKEEFEATQFYKNYVESNGWGEFLMAMIAKTSEKIDLFILTRPATQPPFSDIERAHVRLLVPHLQKAFQISLLLEKRNREVSDLRAAVDEVSSAIFFLDSGGHVVHLNAAARSVVRRRDLFEIKLDRLKPVGAKNNQVFESYLAASIHETAQEFLLTNAAGEDYIVRVLPLSQEKTRATGDGRASKMVFVKRAEIVPSSSIELIAQRYKLTPREMNVLVAIVEAGGVPEAASILGLKQGTVRSHLKSVFAKTNLNSQSELAKLVASFA